MPQWLHYELTRFRWYRRLRRGHWERYYVDWPVASDIWFQQAHGSPRVGLERGRPTCEEWG